VARRGKSLETRLTRVEQLTRESLQSNDAQLAVYRDDPTRLMIDAGFTSDPWQAELLQSTEPRILICAARQVGKSRGVSFLAVNMAQNVPGSTTVIVAPVEDQASELLRKVIEAYHAVGDLVPVKREAVTRLELVNGSRVIALPGKERRMRSFTGDLLLIDEAARVPDEVMNAVSPTMAVSKGRLIALSTAFAKSGWFYNAWIEGLGYQRLIIKASECPRISKEFLASERRTLGNRWFNMEYEGEFQDAVGALFSLDDIWAMRSSEVKPLFPEFLGTEKDEQSSVDPNLKPLFA
jgi:hypothetical protein